MPATTTPAPSTTQAPAAQRTPYDFDTDVLVVGAGPTGLTLAAALAQREVRTLVIDRQPQGENTSRAAVVHARTLEVLEPLGVAQALDARGLKAQRFTIRDRVVIVAPLPDRVHRVAATVDDAPEQPDATYVQALLDARGPQRGRAVVTGVLWGSRFRVHRRVADAYRAGRVLLAGDTEALDAYGTARRPVAQPVVSFVHRLTRRATLPPSVRGLRNLLLSALARVPAHRRATAWRLSGLICR
jgi:2-polyprenyl-6-methoxyphenol hydroxylase-like FAD-dependent oxidoreductase